MTHARERRRVAIYEGVMHDALAGAGMKTEQISREKAGFMQSRATTIILHKLLLVTRFGPNFFAIPRRTGFEKSFKLIIG